MEIDPSFSESNEPSLDATLANPIITVAGYAEDKTHIDQACEFIFGHSLTPEDFVDLIAAPDDSELLVEANQDGESIELKIRHQWSNGTHDYIVYVEDNQRIVQYLRQR